MILCRPMMICVGSRRWSTGVRCGGRRRRSIDRVAPGGRGSILPWWSKLALVLAWRGLGSMRETLRVAQTDVSIRPFLGVRADRAVAGSFDVQSRADHANIGKQRAALAR